MSKSFSSKLGMFAGLTALLTAAVVVAQNEPTRPGQPTRPGTTAQPGAAVSQVDRQLAAWLIVDNENEIALSQLAQQRAKNEDVQEFAQKMVEEHQAFLSKLQKYSPTGRRDATDPNERTAPRANGSPTSGTSTAQPGTSGTSTAQPGTSGTSTNRPGQPGQIGQGGQSAQLDIVSLKRELGEQCLQSARKELEKLQGAEFDKAYVIQQVMVHMVCLDTMKVFKKHASSDLQRVLTEGIETTQTHLDQAKELCKKIDNGSSKSSKSDKTNDSK